MPADTRRQASLLPLLPGAPVEQSGGEQPERGEAAAQRQHADGAHRLVARGRGGGGDGGGEQRLHGRDRQHCARHAVGTEPGDEGAGRRGHDDAVKALIDRIVLVADDAHRQVHPDLDERRGERDPGADPIEGTPRSARHLPASLCKCGATLPCPIGR